jgi:hypothetical protein
MISAFNHESYLREEKSQARKATHLGDGRIPAAIMTFA